MNHTKIVHCHTIFRWKSDTRENARFLRDSLGLNHSVLNISVKKTRFFLKKCSFLRRKQDILMCKNTKSRVKITGLLMFFYNVFRVFSRDFSLILRRKMVILHEKPRFLDNSSKSTMFYTLSPVTAALLSKSRKTLHRPVRFSGFKSVRIFLQVTFVNSIIRYTLECRYIT